MLAVADRVRAAKNGAELLPVLDQLLHPEYGALERLREALETAGEHINDLDEDAYRLAERFDVAAEFIAAAQSELVESEDELRLVR